MYKPMLHMAPVSSVIFLALDSYRKDALIFILMSFLHLITEIVFGFLLLCFAAFSVPVHAKSSGFYSFDKLYFKNVTLLLPEHDSYFMHSNFLKFDCYYQPKNKKFLHFFFPSSSSFYFCGDDTRGLMPSDVGLTFFLFFRSLTTHTYN